MDSRIKRGNIYIVELPEIKGTSIQYGKRGFVILQNNTGNRHSPTFIGAPITSKIDKKSLPTHITIKPDEDNGLFKDSTVIMEQIMTIGKKQLCKHIGFLSDEYMEQIDRAIGISLGLIDNY